MYYEESKKIFEEIQKADRILLSCHKDPDPDSIGSALAFYSILKNMDKKTDVVCASDNLFDQVSYLPGYSGIKKGVDFSSFEYSQYELLIALDTSSIDRITGRKEADNIPIKTIIIDHHKTNTLFGQINLVDAKKTSVGEILFDVFEDCKFLVTKDVSECLMAAIVGDTGAFRYPETSQHTFETVIKLMNLGADKDKAIFNIYRSEDFNVLKFWGEVLVRMAKNEECKYIWSALPYDVFEKCGKPKTGKETAASAFTQNVNGTDFGFVAVEEEPEYLKISFRSRTGFDTSKIAQELGGGGHVYASGASIRGMKFENAVKKLLEVVDRSSKQLT